MDKDRQIKKELRELKKPFENIDKDKKVIADRLLEKAAFMAVTLRELEKKINEEGATVKFEQGSQKMIIENPAQKSYNTMINRYSSLMKQLNDILDKDFQSKQVTESDGFEAFIDS